MLKTKEEIIKWLDLCFIKNYTINDNLTVDVDEDVNISFRRLKTLPIQFNIVKGNFSANDNQLISLIGFPIEVTGFLNIKDNLIKNLEGCPSIIGKSFYCHFNSLSSLKGCPKIINGSFDCSQNALENLIGGPIKVIGSFNCNNNLLKSLEGCPKEITQNFSCEENYINDLYFCPKKVGGCFWCEDNEYLGNLQYTNNFKDDILPVHLDLNKKVILKEDLTNLLKNKNKDKKLLKI